MFGTSSAQVPLRGLSSQNSAVSIQPASLPTLSLRIACGAQALPALSLESVKAVGADETSHSSGLLKLLGLALGRFLCD